MKINNQKHSNDIAVCLNGMDDSFYEQLGAFGEGYIVTSNNSVDMSVKCPDLSGCSLENDESVWWPELGIRMNKNVLNGVYAFAESPIGAPCIECDFDTASGGLSFYFLQEHCDNELFGDVVAAYHVGLVPVHQLMEQRMNRAPLCNTCPCCVDRAERIKESVARHPISQMLSYLSALEERVEFNLNSRNVNMTSQWIPTNITYHAGKINVMCDTHTLRIDAMMVHAIRVFSRTKAKQDYSVMRCYNSLGEVMLEFSAVGHEHEVLWNKMCQSDTANYSPMDNGAFYGG